MDGRGSFWDELSSTSSENNDVKSISQYLSSPQILLATVIGAKAGGAKMVN